jgi:hypothetical protein
MNHVRFTQNMRQDKIIVNRRGRGASELNEKDAQLSQVLRTCKEEVHNNIS